MNKKILTTILILLAFLGTMAKPACASEVAGGSATLKNELAEVDLRLKKTEGFLESYNSPLTGFAANFIEAADKYEIDWKLVVSITGVESTFGKHIPFNSYNAYGWANGAYKFESWGQSIDHVSRVLREKYYDRGLTDPYKIGPVYAPPSSTWAGKVVYFMAKLDCFGDEICLENLDLTI